MTTPTPYGSNYIECFPFSTQNFGATLVANAEQHFTVPGNASQTYRAKFAFTISASVWVAKNVTATVPTNFAAQPYQELLDVNTVRYVQGGDVLSFISSGTPQVSVALLALPI